MQWIDDLETLEQLYGPPVPTSLKKVLDHISPTYLRWIEAARFCILSTVGPEGTDASPRGDTDPVVRVADRSTILMPDWRGNNRTDSLRNIVRDGRVSLMFMVPGSTNVVRVNGTARLTADPAATAEFEQNGKHPRTVTVITVAEVYFQCAKAILRSELWSGADLSATVPTAGDFLRELDAGFDAEAYDIRYAEEAQARMW
ncbi:pyridoxamine 5'-phosphate oxidase family protein [Roseisalinus antarcticus]|uniref:Pyridoxamine 5'-phosphate oxidase n=1 Tax=Roseisalinus antarcticus TaxID=254357 RepID=A0A1Y5RNG5_9RHOB|nr:pyridoxamine 5'-phosphate oxidase family protein [Roseisalinus antarcticus]SLN21718.1 Pyridoxamine 5'-phosphate oxidase [Roseisalinus antarcticus]